MALVWRHPNVSSSSVLAEIDSCRFQSEDLHDFAMKTGGWPGTVEAANRGAHEAGARAAMLTTDKSALFACHGYPTPVHWLTCWRACCHDFHDHDHPEEDAITTPFGMTVHSGLERRPLVLDAIDCARALAVAARMHKAMLVDLTAHA